MIHANFIEAIRHIRGQMVAGEDPASAEKLVELGEKLRSGKASIAFSGHFSAGKSSLINALCGRKLLPSGPIPTSANLVVIEHGTEGAAVLRHGHSSSLAHISLAELDDYCKDGEAYRRIEITYPSDLLGDQLRLLDTPGVDSTDDAHMQATQSSLHLADIVFYVTDYNHVLSETNLSFTKRLKDAGKPLVLIVNQIDKHREEELSFSEYRNKVEEAFRSWGVELDGCLYISLKQVEHPHNEWNKLIWLLTEIKKQASSLLASSVLQSARTVIQEHVDQRFPDGDHPDHEQIVEEASSRLAEWQTRFEQWRQEPERLKEERTAEIRKLIDNAQIMPATTRDLAAAYLESRKPGFKAGLFFAAAKTESEREKRLSQFYEALRDHVEKQLVWHLNGLVDEVLPVELSPAWLAEQVKESAGFTDAYTMTYCREIAEAIKSRYRRLAIAALESTMQSARHEAEKKIAEYAAEEQAAKHDFEEAQAKSENLQRKRRLQAEFIGLLQEAVSPEQPSFRLPDVKLTPELVHQGVRLIHPQQTEHTSSSMLEPVKATDKPSVDRDDERLSHKQEAHGFHYRTVMEQTAEQLIACAEMLANISSLGEVRKSLLDRADKLRQNQFTIALFGAFSAGKSSFASALMGEAVLPVSPNPTTAAINRIVPPTADMPHGTALIRMKTEAALLEDMRYAIAMLGLSEQGITSVDEALKLVREAELAQVPARGKPYLSFIHAVEAGYPVERQKLGTAWKADFAVYRNYVAQENKSCFVEAIDLYADSDFGQQGVIFVDTPGADSIHARHTGVTFDYIKNADAILYVTYYNHAFSQADKQFLLQLGRVKDAMAMDKMFFIINAADLADSAEELQAVQEYVRQELLRHGIGQPRMFAVSSRMALEGKQEHHHEKLQQSGILAFEQSFAAFAEQELAEATVQLAKSEMRRAASRLQSLVARLEQSGEDQKQQLRRMQEQFEQLLTEWRQELSDYPVHAVSQEVIELLHHVKQRCYYRFGEWYNDAFHPSVLQEDGRNISQALQGSWNQLQRSASVDASSELLATTLRLEQYVRNQVLQWTEGASERLLRRIPDLIYDEWQITDTPTPSIEEQLPPIAVTGKELRKYFKNAKSFFEGSGKAQLRQYLENIMLEAVERYVQDHEHRLAEVYEKRLTDLMSRYLTFMQDQFTLYAKQYDEQAQDRSQLTYYRNQQDSMIQFIRHI